MDLKIANKKSATTQTAVRDNKIATRSGRENFWNESTAASSYSQSGLQNQQTP
jgi:hypothetical protein